MGQAIATVKVAAAVLRLARGFFRKNLETDETPTITVP
jgi:hypothetical protein